MQGRYFGSAFLAYGLVSWLAKESTDPVALRAILIGGIVGNVIGLIVSAMAGLNGLQNALTWSSVVIYALMILGAYQSLTILRK